MPDLSDIIYHVLNRYETFYITDTMEKSGMDWKTSQGLRKLVSLTLEMSTRFPFYEWKRSVSDLTDEKLIPPIDFIQNLWKKQPVVLSGTSKKTNRFAFRTGTVNFNGSKMTLQDNAAWCSELNISAHWWHTEQWGDIGEKIIERKVNVRKERKKKLWGITYKTESYLEPKTVQQKIPYIVCDYQANTIELIKWGSVKSFRSYIITLYN